MARPVEYLRADAARNVHRIVEVAARLLGENPNAGMARRRRRRGREPRDGLPPLPDARGADRARSSAQAVEQSEQALRACRLDEGSATDALHRLCDAWLDVAERYAFAQLAAAGRRRGDARAPPPRSSASRCAR